MLDYFYSSALDGGVMSKSLDSLDEDSSTAFILVCWSVLILIMLLCKAYC